MRCKAKAKRTGEQCKAPAVTGRTVCRVHGGTTPRGAALPQYTHGRYSKANIAPQLRERAEALLQDEEYLSLRENIAYHDGAIMRALEDMERGEAGKLWELLKGEKEALQEARAADDRQGQARALNSILLLIDRGHKDYMARQELTGLHLARARLVEAEGRRIERAQASVSAAQLTAIITRMAEAVARYVRDDDAVQALTGEFYRLVEAVPGAI